MQNTLQINEDLNALYILGFIKLKKKTHKSNAEICFGEKCIEICIKKE